MITTLLWDVDGTLLDFHASERAAMKALFRAFALGECTDDMVQRYSAVNAGCWRQLERGEVSREEVLVGRFRRFFAEVGVDPCLAESFNERYQLSLGDTIVYRDDSFHVVQSLRGRVKQYAVSNGTVAAQTKKLQRSGLGALMDGVFLSEELGVEKPSADFFRQVFDVIRPADLTQVMIVGDSLTSDIRGGNNAGIRTCWYNPSGAPASAGYRIDCEIADLRQVPSLL